METQGSKESEPQLPKDARPYQVIQEELYELARGTPDKVREEELIGERARYIRYAEDIGLFGDARKLFIEIQNNRNFMEAIVEISNFNTNKFEQKGLRGWDDRLEGLLEDYKQGAVINMSVAYIEAGGKVSNDERKMINRHKDLLVWGLPKYNLRTLAEQYLKMARGEDEGESKDVVEEIRKLSNVIGGIKEKTLTKEEQYAVFQDAVRWGDMTLIMDPKYLPSFYLDKDLGHDKEAINIMCQLARAVYHKRQEGRTYEGVADNKELGQISKELVRYLYENFPGVREGLEYYARLALNPEKGLLPMERKDGSTFTLSGTSKPGIDEEDAGVRDRDDANLVRGEIEEAIKRSIMKKRDDWNKKGYDIDNDSNSEKIRRLARDAEQIAFNIHYLFNLWEAKGTAWKGGERVFTSRLNAEAFVHPSLRGQMKPLDALIATFRKKGGETAIVGGLSTWAKRQVEISLQGVGERGISFDQVDIIKAFNTPYRAKDMNKKDLKKEEDKYWKIEEYVKDIKDDGTEVKGYILNIPECYPIESMGSLWDEEKVKVEGKPDKALLDYLTEGKDIPWGMVNQDLGGGYVYMASKEKVIWDAYTFNTKTDFGTEPLESALAKRGKRDYYKKIKRWIIYAQEKIRTSSRLPRIEGTKDMRRVIKASFGHVMPPDHILFPWDKV